MNTKLARFFTKIYSSGFKSEIKEMNKRIKKAVKNGNNQITSIYEFSDFARKYYMYKGYIITEENYSTNPERVYLRYTLSW